MPSVYGTVLAADRASLDGLVVQAIDVDLRQDQLLGEVVLWSDRRDYEVAYSVRRFRRAEIATADLLVRALWQGRVVAESEIRFNSGEREKIDLDLGEWTPRAPPALSELEELEAAIAPVRDNVPAQNFSERDIFLLAHEAYRSGTYRSDIETLQERLTFLRDGARLSLETGIAYPAFYAWFRVLEVQPHSVAALSNRPAKELDRALREAVVSNIVPRERFDTVNVAELTASLRDSDPQRVPRRVALRIFGTFADDDEKVLTGEPVEIVDEDGAEFGSFVTDSDGVILIDVDFPADSPGAMRRLRLILRGERPGKAEVALAADLPDVTKVRVPLGPAPGEAVRIGEAVPGALADRLSAAGIATFEDLLARPDVEDGQDRNALEALRAQARLTLAAPDLDEDGRAGLIARHLGHGVDIARMPRAGFVRDFAELLGGEAAAHAVHTGFRRGDHAARHMLTSAWLRVVGDPGDDPDPPDLPGIVIDDLRDRVTCDCEDCENAASPAAYLAHLLDWTLEHVRDVDDPITLDQFEEEFHQPFSDLPTDCASVEDRVCQIRIAVETLWRYNGTLTAPDLDLPTPHRLAYRDLRNTLYKAILTQLGTSFTQLRDAVLDVGEDGPSAEVQAERREAVTRALGIDLEHLADLWFNVEQPPISPSEDDLERLFGFLSTRRTDVFATAERPDLITWQREHILAAWQRQDWVLDEYTGEAGLPVLDPAVITDGYLRAALDDNPAIPVLAARREALSERRAAYEAADPATNGIADLLVEELGETIEVLRTLYSELTSDTPDPARVVETRARIEELGLTDAGFGLLMGIDARQEAGDPVAEDVESAAELWDSAFDALLHAHRYELFAEWVEEEGEMGLVFGPRLFWQPVEPEPLPGPWLVTASERAGWEAALRRRSAPPIIDPDQITKAFLVLVAGEGEDPAPVEALELWTARRGWVDDRLGALGDSRTGASNTREALDAMLAESTIGLAPEELSDLRTAEIAGEVIDGRLAQLGLDLVQFRVLAEAQLFADAQENLGPEQWDAVEAALVRAEKRLEVQQWRLEEQAAGILIRPEWFTVPESLPAVPDTAHGRGLHDPADLRDWIGLLRARRRQFATLEEALAHAVGEAETAFLIGLRDLLIANSVAEGDDPAEMAEWLDRRLLIDMGMTCCQETTRVAQAIETLQRFVRGVYTREHPDLMQHLVLDSDEDYMAAWPVLGTYATWRAYVLAYLYPENILHLAPPPRPSHGYLGAKKALHGSVTPNEACRISKDFGTYYQDVCTLVVQASCQLQTVGTDRAGDCAPTTTEVTSRLHLFGHAPQSGLVYWAHLDPGGPAGDTITTWTPLAKLGAVDRIVGATPHMTGGQQCLLLFVQDGAGLKMRPYDPLSNRWGAIKALSGPPGAEEGVRSVAVVQKRQSGGAFEGTDYPFPTLVGVTVRSGVSYLRSLRPDLAGWSAESWLPLYGPTLGDEVEGLRAILQISSNSYVMIADIGDEVVYRLATHNDDTLVRLDSYEWRRVALGIFRGAFVSPGGNQVFCFYKHGSTTRYRLLDIEFHPIEFEDDGFGFRDIEAFNRDWLIPVLGIDLDDTDLFSYEKYNPDYFVPSNDTWLEGEPLHPPGWVPLHRDNDEGNDVPEVTVDWNGDPSYSGSILGLVIRDYEEFKPKFIPPKDQFSNQLDAEFNDDAKWDRYFYLVQQKYRGIEHFIEWLRGIEGKSYHNETYGWWKFADDRIRELSEDGLSLAQVLEQFVVNKIADEQSDLTGGSSWKPRGRSTRTLHFARREADRRGPSFVIAQQDWRVPPHAGEERSEPLALERITVVVMPKDGFDASFAVPTDVAGDQITGSRQFALAPFGAGPFESLSILDIAELQQRRQHIELMYAPLLGERASVLGYLREAYLHLPIAIGYRLQQGGYFEEALLWYRLVYDYLASVGDRKIDYTLRLEMQGPLDYGQLDAFLETPTDVHAIAATRRNTYTRHILLLIITCLVEQADTLFSRDTAAGNARAREVYRLALRLLDVRVLKPGESPCEDILGELEIELRGMPVSWPQLDLRLRAIVEPRRLDQIAGRLRSIRNQSESLGEPATVRAVRDVLEAEDAEPRPARTVAGVLSRAQDRLRRLEGPMLAHRPVRDLLRESTRIGRLRRRRALDRLVPRTQGATEPADFSWLRLASARLDHEGPNPVALPLRREGASGQDYRAAAVAINPVAGLGNLVANDYGPSNGISFEFCVPQNPVVIGLRERAKNNLEKLRSCRNIAGLRREIAPYGAPIGIGAGLFGPLGAAPVPQTLAAPPTPYRFSALIERAKELVATAERMEDGYRTALESAEREAFTRLQAEQAVELANARVVLRDLFLAQATEAVALAELERNRAAFRHETYTGWIEAGLNGFEQMLVQAVTNGEVNQQIFRRLLAVGKGIAGLVQKVVTKGPAGVFEGVKTFLEVPITEAMKIDREISAKYNKNELALAQLNAVYSRRAEQWRLEQGVAALDIVIADQEIRIAQGGVAIAEQERAIVALQQTHAIDTLNFIMSKMFSEEMYLWIASVLGDVYRSILQTATSTALVAERQLVFERPGASLRIIQGDYWSTPDGSGVDRKGLTGSARLLKDVVQLDQYAFATRRRKARLRTTLDLAQLYPMEFQSFRETGVLVFETPLSLIERQFPGYYLCLIDEIVCTLVGAFPESYGVRGTLTWAGTSRVVVESQGFQTVVLQSQPERLALSSETLTTGAVSLSPEGGETELRRPLEGAGFETMWELHLPKASNPFDYDTIATAFFTIEVNALYSPELERQVVEAWEPEIETYRQISLREDFEDAWEALLNPAESETPMTVRFRTTREDFPPNLSDLRITGITMIVIGAGEAAGEVEIDALRFTPDDGPGPVGGPAPTSGGVVSTLRSNGTTWLPMIGQSPVGEWELALPVEDALIARFEEGTIQNIVLLVTYSAERPPWRP